MPHAPVVVSGPVSWNTLVALDHLPDPRPQMLTAAAHWTGLGGTSAGKALALARLGVGVHLHTVLGTDEDAPRIREALEHPALNLAATTVEGPSEHHLNLMSADGDRLSIYLDSPAPPPLAPDEARRLDEAVGAARVAVLDLAGHSIPLLEVARRLGTEVWCDLHDDGPTGPAQDFRAPFRRAADVVIVSGDRLPDVEGFLLARVEAGARWAICTLGARGAVAVCAERGWWDVGVLEVGVVDPNGAGDSFVAGMLAAHLDGEPLERCLQWGTAAASLTVADRTLVAPGLDRATVAALAAEVDVRRR